MPPKAKGKEKAAPVMSMRLQMKMAEEESKKKEAEENNIDSASESEPESKVAVKSRSRARPAKTESKAKKDVSSASESDQEVTPTKPNQRRSTRVAAPPVSIGKESSAKGKTSAATKRGKANQKASAEQSAEESSEAESSAEETEPAKPAKKPTKIASKAAKKKVESRSESDSEEEEPVRGNRGGRTKASTRANKTAASKKEQQKTPAKTPTKRGKAAAISETPGSDSDDLQDSSDSRSDSENSDDDSSGASSNGETEPKNAKSPQKRIGRPPGAKNKPKADSKKSQERVPEITAPDTTNVGASAPNVPAPNRIKKKGQILDSEVVDQPIISETTTPTAEITTTTIASTVAMNRQGVNFTLSADSSLLKLTQLVKGTNNIPRSASSVSMTSNNSITDLAGSNDIITNTTTTTVHKHNSTTSSSKRIGKKEHVNAEFLNSVKVNRGKWLKELEQKIDTSTELSGARKAAHHSSSYSSSYSTNNCYSDHHTSSTALALWGSLFDDQKTQDATRLFLEKIRMQVQKNNLKKTDRAAYQTVCEVVDKCDVFAVYDKDMYTYTEPSEYARFVDMSLVLQDDAVLSLSETNQVKDNANTESTTTSSSTNVPTTANGAVTVSATSPYEIENETVPKPLHLEASPSDIAQALTWWGMRPDGTLLQEIDRKRAVRAQEYHEKVRQAAEIAEQERLKLLELQAKQKADEERRLKWLERTTKKTPAPSTTTSAGNSTSDNSKNSVVAPPAPTRPTHPVRGPRDRDYSGTAVPPRPPSAAVKPLAPPVPAPPAAAPPVDAAPLPAATAPVPPPPVLTVPAASTSKVHRDRDYSGAVVSKTDTNVPAASTNKSTTVSANAVPTPTTAADTGRVRSKSRDYSEEPTAVPSATTTNFIASSNTSKAPTSAAKDRDYANTSTSRDTSTKSNSARTRDRSDSRHRADSRGRARESAKDPFGRDVQTEQNKEVSRDKDRHRGSKRSRSRSAQRSINTSSHRSDTTSAATTKHSTSNTSTERSGSNFRSTNVTTNTSSSGHRDVSPVLSRALSTGRDGPRGGPSPPTVKSTVSSAGGFRDGSKNNSGKPVDKDGRDRSGKDSNVPIHVPSKVVVPIGANNNTGTSRNNTSNVTSGGGQKRQRSPSPTSSTTSNKKDAFGRCVPALLVTTSERSYNTTSNSATNKTSANDKPLTPTSSYRERNVPRPQGHSHHRDHHHQGQGQGRSHTSYTQNHGNSHNQTTGSRTVHVNDRNYNDSYSRQSNNGNRDRSRQY